METPPPRRSAAAPWSVLLAAVPLLRGDLARALEPIRAEHGVPALAAALVEGGEVTALAAVGRRRADAPESVSVDDRWHLGSCGKAMTATVAARLVERGALDWDTTVAEVFPERAPRFHPDLRGATLRELLDHRTGLPLDTSSGGWRARLAAGSASEQRLVLLDAVLGDAPAYPPGEGRAYSNAGYVIAGAVIERRGGVAFEVALRRELFEPLGMTSAGLGPPADDGADEGSSRTGQPWGHTADGVPIDPRAPFAAHPARYAPAGDVHASLADWARFAALHADPSRGRLVGPSPETLERMHAPLAGADYACGFAVVELPWASGPVLAHHGTSAGWHACLWISPADDLALLVACNQGGAAGERACHAAADAARGLRPATADGR